MPEQARGDRMTSFVNTNPRVLIPRPSRHRRAVVVIVFIEFTLATAAVVGVAYSDVGSGRRSGGRGRRLHVAIIRRDTLSHDGPSSCGLTYAGGMPCERGYLVRAK